MRKTLNILNWSTYEKFGLLSGIIFSLSVLIFYYNQFWYPPDIGAYAHVAERIVNGEVLNLDVHDIHMGYINFLNAGALKLFGNDMASLRIPLVILGVLQSALVFILLRAKGTLVAFAGILAITSLSFIQFLDPTANWYALFFTILIIFSLEKIPENYTYKFAIIGYLLITLFLFRQLSGVITTLGVLTYIFYNNNKNISLRDGILSKIIFAIMIFGLSMYLYIKIPISAIFLFGFWPFILLLNGLFYVSVENRKTIDLTIKMIFGGLVAAAPLILYHFYNGSVMSWYNDTVISALLLTDLSFIQKSSYLNFLMLSAMSIIRQVTIDALFNGLYWIFLILASFILGLIVCRKICGPSRGEMKLSALPLIAVFYGLVSVHYQIPNYLYFSVGLTICGVLATVDLTNSTVRNAFMAIIGLVSIAAIFLHAAQPTERSIIDILQGKKNTAPKVFLGGKVNLWVTEKEANIYKNINQLVEDNVGIEETIFAFPSNSEIYYITDRVNPFRFFNSSFGIRTEEQFERILHTIKTTPPRMVFYNPNDKYNTEKSIQISDYIKNQYTLIENVNGMEYYLLRSQ